MQQHFAIAAVANASAAAVFVCVWRNVVQSAGERMSAFKLHACRLEAPFCGRRRRRRRARSSNSIAGAAVNYIDKRRTNTSCRYDGSRNCSSSSSSSSSSLSLATARSQRATRQRNNGECSCSAHSFKLHTIHMYFAIYYTCIQYIDMLCCVMFTNHVRMARATINRAANTQCCAARARDSWQNAVTLQSAAAVYSVHIVKYVRCAAVRAFAQVRECLQGGICVFMWILCLPWNGN